MLSMNPAGLATGCTALLRTGAHYYPAIVVVGLSGSNDGQLWRRALLTDSGHGALRAICGPFRVPLAGTPYRARREWRRKSALVGTVLLIPSHASQLPGSEAAGAPRPRAGRIKLLSS